MTNPSNYKIFIGAIGLATLIFIMMFIFSSRQTNITNNTSAWIAHTQEVLFHTEKILVTATNIETNARAFQLTGQQQFLQDYTNYKKNVWLELKFFKQLTADNIFQQGRLYEMSKLVNNRISFSDSLITSGKGLTITPALQMITAVEGKIYIEKITALVGQMQIEENRLLKIRKDDNRNAITLQHRMFVFFVFAMLALLITIFWREKKLSLKKEKEKSGNMFRNLIESAPDAVLIIDRIGEIVLINKQAEKLFDYNKSQLMGLPVQTVIRNYIQSAAVGSPVELTAIKRNGFAFPVEITAAPVATNEGLFISVSARDITERKKTAGQLRKSEEFFRLLVTGVKDYAIFMVDIKGFVVSWNSGAENIKGYKEDEIVGESFEKFYSKEDIEKGEPFHNLKMARELGHVEKEGWRYRKDGSKFWANIIFTALKDDKGSLYGYSKITRDITERKKTQEQLELLSLQINQSNDAIYTADANRKIKSWNLGAEKLYGYTKEEMMGKDPNPILKTAMTGEEINSALDEVAKKEYWTAELRRTTKTRKDIWVRTSLNTIRNKDGEITGYVAASYDITVQKKLREEVNHLASMVEQTSEAIFSRGLDQCIISWNRGAEKMFGYSKDEVIGKTALAINFMQLSAAQIREIEKQVIDTGSWSNEMDYSRKDGSSFFGAVTANLIKNETGENTSFYFIVKDISARKKLEDQLKQFEHFFNNSNDLSCIANTQGYFEIVNPGFNKVLGYTQNELSENPFLNFVHPDDVTATLLEYDKLKSGARVIHFFNRYRKKDGGYLWLDWNATPSLATGKLYCIARDITDRKKAEDALGKLNEELELKVAERTEAIKISEKRFRALIENNNDIITLLDQSFKVIYRSPSAQRITGWNAEELNGADGTRNVHPDDLEYAQSVVKELLANPYKPIKTLCRNQHKNGNYLWMEGTVINLLPDEEVKAIVFNFRDVTERIEAAEKLASSELRFRLLIENSAEGIALTDEFSNNFYRSPAAKKMMGPVPIKDTISLTHPDDMEMLRNKHIEILKNPGVPIDFLGRFLHASGQYIWLEGTFTNMLHIKGVNAIVANYRDITQRKHLENLLNKANVLARIGGWEVDLINGTVFWSDITRAIHETLPNYMPDLETGLNFYKEGEGKELIMQKVKEAIELGYPWDEELQIVTAKNNNRWIRTIGETEFAEGKCIRIYGSFQDIDQRKLADEKLVKSEGLYRSLFTNMLNGFSYCEAIFEDDKLLDYTYLAVNNEYEVLTGLKNITGKKMSEVTPNLLLSEPLYAGIIKSVVLDGQNQKFETYVELFGKWFSVSLYSPEKGYFVSLVDNITVRKNAEQKIKKLNTELEERVARRTEQLKKTNEELEVFSYSVSHDLRAPLRAIIGFTSKLEENYSSKLDDEAKRLTSIIKDNTLKMAHLIDDLLTFSRMGRQEIRKSTVDTSNIVQEIMDGYTLANNHPVEWIVHSLDSVYGDLNTLRQVWINLISNAVKYSSGTVAPRIEIGTYKTNEQVTFFVKDNGVGFNEKYKSKLFKVFQRLHSADEFEGTGIGLAIVEKIISKHGGAVWAEAAINEGACFSFSLPLNL